METRSSEQSKKSESNPGFEDVPNAIGQEMKDSTEKGIQEVENKMTESEQVCAVGDMENAIAQKMTYSVKKEIQEIEHKITESEQARAVEDVLEHSTEDVAKAEDEYHTRIAKEMVQEFRAHIASTTSRQDVEQERIARAKNPIQANALQHIARATMGQLYAVVFFTHAPYKPVRKTDRSIIETEEPHFVTGYKVVGTCANESDAQDLAKSLRLSFGEQDRYNIVEVVPVQSQRFDFVPRAPNSLADPDEDTNYPSKQMRKILVDSDATIRDMMATTHGEIRLIIEEAKENLSLPKTIPHSYKDRMNVITRIHEHAKTLVY